MPHGGDCPAAPLGDDFARFPTCGFGWKHSGEATSPVAPLVAFDVL
jgi:hypothetical protein